MSMLTNMELELPSRVRLARRAHQQQDGTWGTTELLEAVPHDETTLSLSSGYDGAGEDDVRIDVSAWHVMSPAEDDAYHIEIGMRLSRADVRQLRDYLAFLLESA